MMFETAAALAVMEDMREEYVRGAQVIAAPLVDRCAAADRACMTVFDDILAGPPGAAT